MSAQVSARFTRAEQRNRQFIPDPVVLANKQKLREGLMAARAQRDPADARLENHQRTVRALSACAGHQCVACYASTGNEPDTWELIDSLTSQGVSVLLPVLSNSTGNEPRWGRYSSRTLLRPAFRGILEPTQETDPGDVTFVWCAGLAGCTDGRRIGIGGGWYDRALARLGPHVTAGLLLWDEEILPDIPVEPWDRRVQLIVTENRTITTGA